MKTHIPKESSGRAGYTMVEVAVSTVMLIIMIGGTYTSVSQAGDSWTTVVTKTQVQDETRTCINAVAEDLKHAGNVWIDTSTKSYTDIVRFQMPLGIKSDGTVLWGARQNLDGVEGSQNVVKKAGWWVEYMVHRGTAQDGRANWMLIKRFLDGSGNYTGHKILIANHIDKPRLKKGFEVRRSGELFNISIRIAYPTAEEAFGTPETWVKLKSTVATRNWTYDSANVVTPPTPQ